MTTEPKHAEILRNANLRLCRLRVWSNYNGFGFNVESSSKPPYIHSVESCSPAAASGLKPFDVILAINNKDISAVDDNQMRNAITFARDRNGLMELLVVEQRFYRSLTKKKIKYDVNFAKIIDTPQTMPADYQLFVKYQPRVCIISSNGTGAKFGFDVTNGENDIGLYIEVVYPNTPASETSLRKNDRIIEINDKFVDKKTNKSIIKKLGKAKVEGYVKLYVINMEIYKYYKLNKIPLASKNHRKNRLYNRLLKLFDDQLDAKYQSNDDNSCDIDNEHYVTQTSSPRCDLHFDMDQLPNASDDDESYISNHYSYMPAGAIRVRKKCYLTSAVRKNSRPSIIVCKGDLATQQTDVIVVCSSSKYLFDSICNVGGDSILDTYNAKLNSNPKDPIISVKVDGQLRSKRIYFLPWTANSDKTILRQSLEAFVSDAIEKAAQENYQSIAFPAIGCGRFGCSISLIAQTMIKEADRQLSIHSISVLFVIQPERMDIYDEFQKQIHLLQSQLSAGGVDAISTTIGKGVIEVEEGDITMQMVDVIVGSSSSDSLRKAIIKAAGYEVQTAFNAEYKKDPNSVLIATPPGALPCKRIFFLNWQPDIDEKILQQSVMDLMLTVIQNVNSHKFTSIAFPAIGCGGHGCSVDIIVKTMVKEMKTEMNKRNLPWTVKFVIQPDQLDIYDKFCKQILTTDDDLMESQSYQIPLTWEKSKENKKRFVLSITSDEYRSVTSNFDQAMQGKYTQIIRIERIQNERCYMQYLAHCKDFEKRLNMDTEKRLYHGCPEQASDGIINGYFNRSFAGKNGTLYGQGVYFSSNAAYSHRYATENMNKERCMFVARVLVGKSAIGRGSMITPPDGFDSTTDGKHIFVTYHDAQALAEYLITYK